MHQSQCLKPTMDRKAELKQRNTRGSEALLSRFAPVRENRFLNSANSKIDLLKLIKIGSSIIGQKFKFKGGESTQFRWFKIAKNEL